MLENSPEDHDQPPALAVATPPGPAGRLAALTEVVVCSGFPTQLALVFLFSLVGLAPVRADGSLSLAYVVVLSLADAALLLALVWTFLRIRDEQPRALFLGTRPVRREVLLGLVLVPVALLITALSFGVILEWAPSLRNVPENPLESLIDSPLAVLLFALVAVFAGGVREEVQRAFILHRFEQRLGGALVGLVVFSAAFGLGHLVQGRDAAIVTALLGGFWGVVYLLRRSIVAPIACHAAFNLTEIAIAWASA